MSSRTESPTASQFSGKRTHFIGIGGSGMSGLARMLLDAGAIVSGSEPNPGSVTFELMKSGAKVSRSQIGEFLSPEIDLVVRTAAVNENNAEWRAARALGLRTVKYAELLGMVMAERVGVAVAGTHGKSTTSAMISYALTRCGADPSFVIGGTVSQLGGGSRSGAGGVFVAEACEFDRSFHNLRPRIAVITNIEEDHLDCYKDINEIVESFHRFARLVPAEGTIIASGQDGHVALALKGIESRVELTGVGQGFAWSAKPLGILEGCRRGEILHDGKSLGIMQLSVPGQHNLINATMAVAVCAACGLDPRHAMKALEGFSGVDRRMTILGQYQGATVVDDYGHHPTEIRATLVALRERFGPKRLICVFQPHQHSRTRFLLEDFAQSFVLADQTIVPDIYFVRDSEAERQRITSLELVQRIRAHGQAALHLPEFPQILAHLRSTAGAGDLIVTMGAGNVWEIARDLVDEQAGPAGGIAASATAP